MRPALMLLARLRDGPQSGREESKKPWQAPAGAREDGPLRPSPGQVVSLAKAPWEQASGERRERCPGDGGNAAQRRGGGGGGRGSGPGVGAAPGSRGARSPGV